MNSLYRIVFIAMTNFISPSYLFRSSHQRCSIETLVLKHFTKFTGKHLCQSLFFKVEACNFIKKATLYWCFPVNFVKFLSTTFNRTLPDDCFYLLQVIHPTFIFDSGFKFALVLEIIRVAFFIFC